MLLDKNNSLLLIIDVQERLLLISNEIALFEWCCRADTNAFKILVKTFLK